MASWGERFERRQLAYTAIRDLKDLVVSVNLTAGSSVEKRCELADALDTVTDLVIEYGKLL